MSDVVVKVEKLRKNYGRNVAVDGIDFEVPKGSVFGLLGPNGAGKSTTFGILCGWLRSTSGAAFVLGTPSHRLFELRGRVAVLPQDAHFPPQISVREELAHFGRLMGIDGKEALRQADEALERVSLTDAAKLKGSELSHGMGKRVGLAQALIGRPDLVFLDEPTAGLDPKSAHQVKSLIASLAPESTVILSSHNLVDVQAICTHGVILNKGRIAAAGSIDVLTRRGAEITVELAEGSKVPQDALKELFGNDSVTLDAAAKLTLRFSADEDMAGVIKKALDCLYAHDAKVLGVSRGTSLETAFLEATSGQPSSDPAAA